METVNVAKKPKTNQKTTSVNFVKGTGLISKEYNVNWRYMRTITECLRELCKQKKKLSSSESLVNTTAIFLSPIRPHPQTHSPQYTVGYHLEYSPTPA